MTDYEHTIDDLDEFDNWSPEDEDEDLSEGELEDREELREEDLSEDLSIEEISQITGYESSDREEELEDNLLDEEDFIEGQKDATDNPLIRFAFIGTFLAILFGLGGLIWFMFSSGSPNTAQLPEQENREQLEDDNSAELSQLKAELALRNQQVKQIPTEQKEIKKNLEPQPLPQPVVRTQPKPRPQPRTRPQPKPQTVVRRQQPRRITTPPKPTPVKKQPVVQKKSVDSARRWNELSQIGSMKAKGKSSRIPLSQLPVASSNTSQQQVSNQNKSLNVSNKIIINNDNSLPVQKASAIVESGITIPANNQLNSPVTIPIVLKEPLLDRSGVEVIPAGATIIAEVQNSSSVMQIVPVSISFEKDKQYYELNLEGGSRNPSIIITGNNGPIIAQTKTIGANGEGLSINQLGQLAALTGGMAGIDSARDVSVILGVLGLNNRRNYSRSQSFQVFTVPEGIEVVVRVVKNFPIDLPSNDFDNLQTKKPQIVSNKVIAPLEEEYDFDTEYIDPEYVDKDPFEVVEYDFDSEYIDESLEYNE